MVSDSKDKANRQRHAEKADSERQPFIFPIVVKVSKQTNNTTHSALPTLYFQEPSQLFFFFKVFVFIYLFIYGCVGSSFLCEGFL